jgi:photosystem II stability/assembly factor-like uncharacterized protein
MNSTVRNLTTFKNGSAAVVFVLGLLLAPAVALAQTGWHPQNLPALEPGVTYALSDVKALNGTEAWISGGLNNGEAVVLKTLDGGTWTLMFHKGEGSTDPWQRFWSFGRLSVVDSSNAWVAGSFSLTAFTTDGGATWSHEGTPCGTGPGGTIMHNYGLKAVSSTNVWVVGWDPPNAGLIWHRPYGGNCNDWGYWPYRQEDGYNNANVLAIDAADALNAWAVGYPGIVHTSDGGTWVTQVPSPGGLLEDVTAVSPDVAWAVGSGGLILKTVDAGAHWVVQGSGVAVNLHKISAVSADVAWVVGDNGTILKTIDGGATWRSQVSGVSDAEPRIDLVGVTAVDANTAWAVSNQQIVLHVSDGGAYQPLSVPAISGLSPAGGPIAGGTIVGLSGPDFRPGARVFFVSESGSVPAARVEFSQGGLVVTTPAHVDGIVDVTVINPDGQSATRAKAFAFADTQPLIVSLWPSYGYVDTTVQIDVFGAGLTPNKSSYTPVPTVNINGTPVSGAWSSYSDVYVTFDRSLLTAAGMADITVTTTAGMSNTLQFAVNYGSVSVDKPSSPPYNKSVTIQSLSGPVQATFYGMTWSGWVKVGKVFEQPQWVGGNSPPPTGYTFLPTYYYEITTYPSMHYQAATMCFPYAAADISAAGLDESKLRLMHYLDNQNAWEDVTFTLDTTANVICGTSSEPMSYLALARGPEHGPSPAITGIEPAIGPRAGGTTVTISGSLFPPNATVTFGGVAAANVSVVNGMKITATIPTHALGFVDVIVMGADLQTSTLVGGFEYVGPPTVTSVTPDRGRQYGYTDVTIKGTGFRSGNGGSIRFGGTQLSSSIMIDDTTITARTPSHTPGLVDVVVTNPDGQFGTLVNGYTYVPAPTITSVVPSAGPVEGGTPLTITGTDFQAGTTVTFAGTAATDIVVVNATTITAVTPAHAAGAVLVTVTTPDSQSGNRYSGFTYSLPVRGDVNADFVVDIRDAIVVLQVMSAKNPVPASHISADVNNDGAIGIAEAIFILQTAAQIR